jgi:hypothetical protein
MNAKTIFMDEIVKVAGLGVEIGEAGEAAVKGLGEKLRTGGGALRGAIAKYPGVSGLAGLGLGALALHHYSKRKEAERRLGM